MALWFKLKKMCLQVFRVETRKCFDKMIFINSLRILYRRKIMFWWYYPLSNSSQVHPFTASPNFMFFCLNNPVSSPVSAARGHGCGAVYQGPCSSRKRASPLPRSHQLSTGPQLGLRACETPPTASWRPPAAEFECRFCHIQEMSVYPGFLAFWLLLPFHPSSSMCPQIFGEG